jgi:hypothetical protein
MLTGCSDFLDKEVKGNATDENYYDTQYKMQSALDAAYDELQSDAYNDQEWRFGEAMGDNVFGTDEGLSSQMGQLVNFRFNTSNTWILQRWQENYKGIHRANQVIYNIDRVRISTNAKTAYDGIRWIYGQAKFLRAYYYFNLVKTFGGVPIRPEQENVEGLVVPRSSLEECYAYIEKDLREAAVMLPVVYASSSELGKATRGAAVGLLMKVLMYEAKPGVPSDKWQQMVDLGKYMVDGQSMTYAQMLRYDGSEDWETLRKRLWFKPVSEITGGTSNTSEYERPTDALSTFGNTYSLAYNDYYGNPLHNGDKMAYLFQFFSDGEFCKGSVWEVNFKESGDGTGGDTNEGQGLEFFDVGQVKMYSTDQLLNNIFGSDVRKDFTIHHQGQTFDGEIWQGGEGNYVSLKWYTPKVDKPKYGGDNGRNRRVLRYADIVLMYAEALNETGDRVAALDNLNKCKAQVNTINSSTKLYVAGGYGYLRDQIWQERRMEFAFEWDRYFDLVRQGQAAKTLHAFSAYRTNRRGAFFREGVNELMPIPQTEIDVSHGVVEQNPGY